MLYLTLEKLDQDFDFSLRGIYLMLKLATQHSQVLDRFGFYRGALEVARCDFLKTVQKSSNPEVEGVAPQ